MFKKFDCICEEKVNLIYTHNNTSVLFNHHVLYLVRDMVMQQEKHSVTRAVDHVVSRLNWTETRVPPTALVKHDISASLEEETEKSLFPILNASLRPTDEPIQLPQLIVLAQVMQSYAFTIVSPLTKCYLGIAMSGLGAQTPPNIESGLGAQTPPNIEYNCYPVVTLSEKKNIVKIYASKDMDHKEKLIINNYSNIKPNNNNNNNKILSNSDRIQAAIESDIVDTARIPFKIIGTHMDYSKRKAVFDAYPTDSLSIQDFMCVYMFAFYDEIGGIYFEDKRNIGVLCKRIRLTFALFSMRFKAKMKTDTIPTELLRHLTNNEAIIENSPNRYYWKKLHALFEFMISSKII
jgi:hypothetical protein